MSNTELLKECRQRGWERVAETVPAWVRERIIAFRSSVLAGLEFRMSARQVQEAETRSALSARNFARTLFPVRKSLEQRFVESHGYDPWLLRDKALRIAFEIKREARVLAAARAASKPDYLCTADELYHRSMAREYEARAIAQVEVAGCRAKDAEGHRRAADFHCDQARNCRSIERAKLHYDAADAHRRAADSLTEQTASDAHRTCLVARNWVTPAEGGQQ